MKLTLSSHPAKHILGFRFLVIVFINGVQRRYNFIRVKSFEQTKKYQQKAHVLLTNSEKWPKQNCDEHRSFGRMVWLS